MAQKQDPKANSTKTEEAGVDIEIDKEKAAKRKKFHFHLHTSLNLSGTLKKLFTKKTLPWIIGIAIGSGGVYIKLKPSLDIKPLEERHIHTVKECPYTTVEVKENKPFTFLHYALFFKATKKDSADIRLINKKTNAQISFPLDEGKVSRHYIKEGLLTIKNCGKTEKGFKISVTLAFPNNSTDNTIVYFSKTTDSTNDLYNPTE